VITRQTTTPETGMTIIVYLGVEADAILSEEELKMQYVRTS
jgi:hypothetical protein